MGKGKRGDWEEKQRKGRKEKYVQAERGRRGRAGLNACVKPLRSTLPDLEVRFRLCLTGLTNTELESPGHLLRAGFLLSRENELSISPWQSADSPAD